MLTLAKNLGNTLSLSQTPRLISRKQSLRDSGPFGTRITDSMRPSKPDLKFRANILKHN